MPVLYTYFCNQLGHDTQKNNHNKTVLQILHIKKHTKSINNRSNT